jgi:hypothetical protein
VGASAITLDDGSAHADFPVDNLIDDRAGTLFKFAAPRTTAKIEIDLGADFVTGLERLIIPANHNLVNIRVWQATESDYSGETSMGSAIDVTPGTLIDYEFPTFTTSKRYIRLSIGGGPIQWQLPQMIFTKIETLTVGPDLANSADGYRANVTRLIQNTGLAPTVLHGPQQRVMEYNYAPIEGNDLTKMEALIATVGMDKPFFVDPASFSATPAADDPPIWMKFDDMPESRHTVLVPMSNAESKAFSLRLIESLD